MSFLTRTQSLDHHVATRLRIRAKQISDSVKRDNERFGEDLKDIDGPPMLELAEKFDAHEDTDVIGGWILEQDTAFREYIPQMVYQILRDNTYE
jgi:hypothetical protein